MELLPLQLKDRYLILNDKIQNINFFIFLFNYIIIKSCIKISKIRAWYKEVLIYNFDKKYIIEN